MGFYPTIIARKGGVNPHPTGLFGTMKGGSEEPPDGQTKNVKIVRTSAMVPIASA